MVLHVCERVVGGQAEDSHGHVTAPLDTGDASRHPGVREQSGACRPPLPLVFRALDGRRLGSVGVSIRHVSRSVLAVTLAGVLAARAGRRRRDRAGRRQRPEAGASGIGDPYWPLDGNGGIDVASYRIHDRYDLATKRLAGRTAVSFTGHRRPVQLHPRLPPPGPQGHRRRRRGRASTRTGGGHELPHHAEQGAAQRHHAHRSRDVRRQPGDAGLRRRAQLAGQHPRGRHHERAAHGCRGGSPPTTTRSTRRSWTSGSRSRRDARWSPTASCAAARRPGAARPGTGGPTSRWCPTWHSSPPVTSRWPRASVTGCRGWSRSPTGSHRRSSVGRCG